MIQEDTHIIQIINLLAGIKAGHGWLNVTAAIEKSCNYFFYETGRRTGIERIDQVASAFGLGQKTGIELAGEVSGTLASEKTMGSWSGRIYSSSSNRST